MKKAQNSQILLGTVFIVLLGVILVDSMYVSNLKKEFTTLEKQRIVVSNKLATAKIVHENLNHVRDLVLANMDIPGNKEDGTQESKFFEFITTCVNDLKLKLVSVKPLRPIKQGRITTYSYNIIVEGDFFSFGELCSKFENSRKIVSLEAFEVSLVDKNELKSGGAENKVITVKMKLDTYRVSKN
jgi:Tfp pilus assembly protein PilO